MKLRSIAVAAVLLATSAAAASQRVNDASIQGMVLSDGTSQPVEGVTVGAYLGDELEEPVQTATTNGSGTFVIAGLRSNQSYSLKFRRDGYVEQFFGQEHLAGMFFVGEVKASSPSLPSIVMRLIPNGTIRGRVQDTGTGLSGIPVGLLSRSYGLEGKRTFDRAGEHVLTDARGEFLLGNVAPGQYVVFAGGSAETFGVRSEPTQYPVVYYPNSAVPESARSVEVRPASDTMGIDFTMSRQDLHHVRGRVIEEETGRPPFSASIFADIPDLMSPVFTLRNGTHYDGITGTFEITLASGEHQIGAQVIGSPCLAARGLIQVDGAVTSVISTGSTRVQVRDGDLDGSVVVLRKARCLSGDARSEEGSLPLDWMHFYLKSSDKQMKRFVVVHRDGTFELDGLMPNEYRLSGIFVPDGSYLKEAKFGNIDILNATFRVDSTTTSKTHLVLSSRVAQIEGVVRRSDRVAAHVTVVLVPDKMRDRHDLYEAAVTDARGNFLLKSVAPGDYKAFAWDSIEERSWLDADVLSRYEQQGKPVRVRESFREKLALQLITAQ